LNGVQVTMLVYLIQNKSFYSKCLKFKYKGYIEHAISVISEWVMVIVTVIVIATLYPDFKNIKFKPIQMFGIHVDP
jgi:hypothetical protein